MKYIVVFNKGWRSMRFLFDNLMSAGNFIETLKASFLPDEENEEISFIIEIMGEKDGE